jgi:hypothetical protein
MPEWEALKSVWPLFAGLGALWVRLEVALAQTRQQSIENAKEIAKLEAKADAQTLRSNDQAAPLATGQVIYDDFYNLTRGGSTRVGAVGQLST